MMGLISPNGTFETSSNVRYPVAIGGQADVVQQGQKWRV
jgi:hypothetical protein